MCDYRIPEARGQTERFLVLFEKTSFADNDWRFSEWGKLLVCPPLPVPRFPRFPRAPPTSYEVTRQVRDWAKMKAWRESSEDVKRLVAALRGPDWVRYVVSYKVR